MKTFPLLSRRIFFPALVAAMAILLLVWPAVDRGSSYGWFSGSADDPRVIPPKSRKGGKDDESITLRDVAFLVDQLRRDVEKWGLLNITSVERENVQYRRMSTAVKY